ncbi:GNAT family N-acetyltransferase [Pseudalkalibacillus decolorationis]|uniref:GNAT family N-acetyltransferase n=1 Tax=Pseudalkalibacillus decolorationis TaxID=163879 RepID=UPI003555BEF5
MLETDRLHLRSLTMSDVCHLMKIFSDPVAMAYYPSTKTETEAKQWIEWNLQNYQAFNVGLWAVELKKDQTFVGQCGIVPQKVNGIIQMEIGYSFIREFWGNGFATEAAKSCLNYGFQTCQYPKMISLITPNNTPSIAVAQRIGMKKECQIIKWDRPIHVYSSERMEKSPYQNS